MDLAALKRQIQTMFQSLASRDRTIARIAKKISDGTATYTDSSKYAEHLGNALAKAFQAVLTDEVIPADGISEKDADVVIGDLLRDQYGYVSDIAGQVQTCINKAYGLGLKAVKPDMSEDRISGIANRASYDSTRDRDEMRRTLGTNTANYSMSVSDDSCRENVEYQSRAGVSAKIVRRVEGFRPCQWCQDLAGEYDYGSQPDDIFRRHDNCNCTVEYIPDRSSSSQDVWTKQWSNVQNKERESRISTAQDIDNQQSATAQSKLEARHSL